jgi:hypothetical protein
MTGGGKQKSTSTSEPWGPWQPYLKDVMGQAQEQYQGATPQFWQGTANAGLTPEMQQAIGGIWDRAQAGNPLIPTAQGTVGAVAGGNLVGSNPAYGFLGNMLYGGGQNPALGMAGNLAAQTMGGQNPALQYLTQEASGANVGRNPWLDATFAQAADPIQKRFKETTVPGLQSDYAMAGRYGSNALSQAVGNARGDVMGQMGDLATKIYGGAYGQDRASQLQAMQGLSGAYGQDIQSKIGAGNFLSGIYDTDQQRKLYAAQQMGQLGQQDVSNMLQAAGMAPGMAQADYGDLDRQLQIGQYMQGRGQSEQDLARQRFDYEQNAQRNALTEYAKLIYGMPAASSGTTTQTQTGGGSGIFGSILGGLGSAGSLIAGAPQIGAGFNFLFGR